MDQHAGQPGDAQPQTPTAYGPPASLRPDAAVGVSVPQYAPVGGHGPGQPGAWQVLAPPVPPLPPAPSMPPVPSLPPGVQLPRRQFPLTVDDLIIALRIAVSAFAPVLAVLTVSVALVSLTSFPDGHGGGLADWLRSGVVLIVLALAGRLILDGGLDSSEIHGTFAAGLRIAPLTITVAVLLLAGRAGRRAERDKPSTGPAQLLLRSSAAGLVAGVVLAVLAAVSTTSAPFGADLNKDFLDDGTTTLALGPSALGAFIGATLLVTAAVTVARLRVSGLTALWASRPEVVRLRAVLGVVKTFIVGMLAVAAVVMIVGWCYRLTFGHDAAASGAPTIFALVFLSANVVIGLVLVALGIPLGSATGHASVGSLLGAFDSSLKTGDNGTFDLFLGNRWLLLVVLIPVVVALGSAMRRTLRYQTFSVDRAALKVAAGVGAVLALAAALALQIALTSGTDATGTSVGSGQFRVSVNFGFSLLWAPLLGALWGVLVAAAVRLGPTLVLSLPRPLVRVIGGRRIAPDWAAALRGEGPPPSGHTSRTVRLVTLAALGVMVVVGVGVVVVALIGKFVTTPQAAVRDYFQAVATRNVGSALGHLTQPPDPRTQPLLGADVLNSPDYSGISHIVVGDVTERGSFASVEASYTVAGAVVSETIRLNQPSAFLGMGEWKIDGGGAQVTVGSDDGLAVTVAGRRAEGKSLAALPGAYDFRVAGNAYLEPAEMQRQIEVSSNEDVQLSPSVRSSVRDAVESAVTDRLAVCSRQRTLPLGPLCPFFNQISDSAYSFGNKINDQVRDVSITVTQVPTLQMTYDASSDNLLVASDQTGDASVTGTETYSDDFGAETSPYEDQASFSINGRAFVAAGKVTVVIGDGSIGGS